jgi:methylase of polypeptide subunit release factors
VRNKVLNNDEYHKLLVNTDLRLKRMPIQYVIGEWDFCGLTMNMSQSPSVFIPRPETEDLVSIASELVRQLTSEEGNIRNPYCFEIGCGSGAISLALLSKHDEVLTCTRVSFLLFGAVNQNIYLCLFLFQLPNLQVTLYSY